MDGSRTASSLDNSWEMVFWWKVEQLGQAEDSRAWTVMLILHARLEKINIYDQADIYERLRAPKYDVETKNSEFDRWTTTCS